MVTLVPVIGLVQVGGQAHADRYMYIPMVGLLIMLVWGAAEILEKLRAKVLALPLAAAACLACAVLTWIQVGYWRNSETLFRHALEVTDDNSVANHNLGNYLMDSPGRLSEALPYLETAVRIDPDSAPAHTDLGSALARTGRLPEAIAQFQAAIRLAPDSPIPHNNLGSAFIEAGRLPEAIAEFHTALRLDPAYDEALRNLAAAQAGGSTETHASRGIALLKAGDPSGAITELEAALRIDPNDADAQNNLGVALSSFPDASARIHCSLRSRRSPETGFRRCPVQPWRSTVRYPRPPPGRAPSPRRSRPPEARPRARARDRSSSGGAAVK